MLTQRLATCVFLSGRCREATGQKMDGGRLSEGFVRRVASFPATAADGSTFVSFLPVESI